MAKIAKLLSRSPVAERRKIQGIGPLRAEIIVAGATVYRELLDRCRLKGFRYSALGLRDGLFRRANRRGYDRSTRSANRSNRNAGNLSPKRLPITAFSPQANAFHVRQSAMFCFLNSAPRASLAAGISRVAFGCGDVV